jgi:acyl-CoA synthetase (AMP-forming)/AMP-acid ligase II
VEISLRGRERRILVASSSVAERYIGPPEASHAGRFVRGGFLTGDAGKWDRHGRLCLAGRLDARVNVSGRKVDPLEVERALRECPAVVDAAVLGVPDATRGEALAACVVGRGGLTRERVLAHLRGRLASYKIPRRIRFLREIPRGGRGKPDRVALRRAVFSPEAGG